MNPPSPQRDARLAGHLYVLVVAASSFALFKTSSLIVGGDAAATAAAISASQSDFRLAFAANLLAAAAYVAVVAILYPLFQPVSRTGSVVAAFFGLAGCAVSAASMISLMAALHFIIDPGVLAAFDKVEAEELARAYLRLGGFGNNISLVFFGFYCVLLGCLVLGASFMPRGFGVLLIVGGLAWLANSFGGFMAVPIARDASPYLMGVGAIGEIAFTLWILLFGVNARKWLQQAAP
jgi:hypothetical protein